MNRIAAIEIMFAFLIIKTFPSRANVVVLVLICIYCHNKGIIELLLCHHSWREINSDTKWVISFWQLVMFSCKDKDTRSRQHFFHKFLDVNKGVALKMGLLFSIYVKISKILHLQPVMSWWSWKNCLCTKNFFVYV